MNLFRSSRRGFLQSGLLLAVQPWFARYGTGTQSPRVVVVGAGLAGLAAALELEAHGYSVILLEAQRRCGGRNWTIRRGDVISDVDGSNQQCGFSAGQYLNAGPWRILPDHWRVLDYARRFGVALEQVSADPAGHSVRPVGGMDVLPQRMRGALRGPLIEGAVALNVGLLPGRDGVIVGYRHDGHEAQIEANYVLISLPLNQLAKLQLPLAAPLKSALTHLQPADAARLAFELTSLPEHTMSAAVESADWQLHWPQGDHPQQRIVSLYANGRALAGPLAGSAEAKLDFARAQIEATLVGAQELQAPLIVQWSRIPYQCAAAVRFTSDSLAVGQLRAGQPPLFFAGDGLSALNGWQEGAIESAQQAVRQLRQFHLSSA